MCIERVFFSSYYSMIIRNKKKIVNKSDINLFIENQKIECVTETKYLGMIIDEFLDFNKHVDYLCKKASSKVGLLHRIKDKISTEERICIYKTIFAPHFEYCASILFCLNESQFKRIQKIQNRGMRAVMRVNKRTSVKLMLETLNWLSVKQLIYLRTLQLIHKMCNGKVPNYLSRLIKRKQENHNYNLRNINDLNVRNLNRNNTRNSITCEGFKLFNKLPSGIKEEINCNRYKRKIIDWIKLNILY